MMTHNADTRDTTSLRADRLAVSLLFTIALIIRLIGLQRLSLWGDEILSLRDASQLGRTLNGFLYFVVLRLVTLVTTDSFWLRLPAILMGAAALVPFFFFLRNVAGAYAARLGALLYALSPFAVLYSQEVRFYGLYLFVGSTSLLLLSGWEPGAGWRRTTGLVSGWILLLSAHFLGILAVIGQFVAMLWLALKRRGRAVLLTSLGFIAIVSLVMPILFRGLVGQIYSAIFYSVGASAGIAYTGPRGLTFTGLAKIPFTFYFFAVGENLHPFIWFLSIPAILVSGYLVARGFWKSRSTSPRLWLYAWTFLLLPVGLLFLVLDPVSDPNSGLAAPKYIAFALFPFIALITFGVFSHTGRWRSILAVGAVSVALLGLAYYFTGDWSYNTHKLTRWEESTAIVRAWEQRDTVFVVDGRSNDEWSYYLPDWFNTSKLSLDLLAGDSLSSKQNDLIVTAYPGNQQTLDQYNRNLRLIQSRMTTTGGYYQNNLTILHYSSSQPPSDINPQALIPYDLIDTRYSDLTLPQPIKLSNEEVHIAGGFGLRPGTGLDERTIQIVPGRNDSRTLEMVTNGSELTGLTVGTTIAQTEVRYQDGSEEVLPLRLGIETADWTSGCGPGFCRSVFNWTKRAQLTGNQSTSTSWQQFQASWFVSSIQLSNGRPVSMRIRYLLDKGQLQVWAIRFY